MATEFSHRKYVKNFHFCILRVKGERGIYHCGDYSHVKKYTLT